MGKEEQNAYTSGGTVMPSLFPVDGGFIDTLDKCVSSPFHRLPQAACAERIDGRL